MVIVAISGVSSPISMKFGMDVHHRPGGVHLYELCYHACPRILRKGYFFRSEAQI